MSELPSCHGVAWDAPAVDDCRGCKEEPNCKVAFAQTLGTMPNGEDPNAIAAQLSVSVEAVQQGLAILNGGDQNPPAEKPTVEPTAEDPPTEEPTEEKQIPFKKRRGRKPANLVECSACSGTGWNEKGDGPCPICGGYGDRSFQPDKDQKKGSGKTSKGTGKKPVDSPANSGDGAGAGVAGGNPPSRSPAKPLPVQGETVSNTVPNSKDNSWTASNATKATAGVKKAKGKKAQSGLVGSPLLQTQELVGIAKEVRSLEVDYQNRWATIRISF